MRLVYQFIPMFVSSLINHSFLLNKSGYIDSMPQFILEIILSQEVSVSELVTGKSDFKTLQHQIFSLKSFFEQELSRFLNLTKVNAPLYLSTSSGLNDNLNGVEHPVTFSIDQRPGDTFEVVQSLAKWKRFTLGQQGFAKGEGLFTDMRALRPSDLVDNTHSVYVDQWDWERVMYPGERNINFLKETVQKIFRALKNTERFVYEEFFKHLTPSLPENITFIHSQELLNLYPNLTAKEREYKFAKETGAFFIIGVGAALSNGEAHDLRAPDYDDWTTENEQGFLGLNGDLVVFNPVSNESLELSSMGIRVNKEALQRQLEIRGTLDRNTLPFHSALMRDELPQTIGGGIGQSRVSMFLLRKNRISEVHA